ADKKAADKKAAAKKAAKKKALPKTGAIAGSVALMGLALASTGSVFAFRRRK
ncbi:LPXTG-motif protein cell wall anchor domain protein, partial [Aerococcus christensenii]